MRYLIQETRDKRQQIKENRKETKNYVFYVQMCSFFELFKKLIDKTIESKYIVEIMFREAS